ncbi:MAG: hemerythrin family protein [Sideroxydans sp.]|nr:hemerythrin family protein [Sideroxydans sp.]
MAIAWREQLSVGNNIIDDDHKYLIEIINRVEACLGRKDMAALQAELRRLHEYSLLHFDREERIATAIGYQQTPGLQQSHQVLMEKLAKMQADFVSAEQSWSPDLVKGFADFLRNWLIDHVIKEDLLMKPSLQKYSPAYTPW